MYIELMINTALPASNSVFQVFGRLKNDFDILTKLIFQIMCVAVVQWCSGQGVLGARADIKICFFVPFFFFAFSLCLLILFFLLACFPLFLLLTLLIMLIDQYVFQCA